MTNKRWAVLCHAGGFMGNFLFFLGNIVIVFVLWLISRDDPFADRHGKAALNFQITISILVFILLLFICVGFIVMGLGAAGSGSLTLLIMGLLFFGGGLITLLILLIAEIVFVVKAAVKASKGEDYTYPLTVRFVK